MLRSLLVAVAAVGACSASVQPTADSPLSLTRTIEMPGVTGRIDHLALDMAHKRLYVVALGNGSVEMIDLGAGAVTKHVTGLSEPQGIGLLGTLKIIVVACGGDGTVRGFNAETLEPIRQIRLGDDADNLRVPPDEKVVYVGFGNGAVAALDPATLAVKTQVKLPGHPESFQLAPDGASVFVNVPGGFVGGGGSVVVGDTATGEVKSTWELKDAGRNFPMAVDDRGGTLFVGCRRPAKLLVVDAHTGKTTAVVDCIGDADEVFFDAATRRVFVVGGDGAADIFKESEGKWTRIARTTTSAGARTGLLTPDGKTLYVACPAHGDHPARIQVYAVAP